MDDNENSVEWQDAIERIVQRRKKRMIVTGVQKSDKDIRLSITRKIVLEELARYDKSSGLRKRSRSHITNLNHFGSKRQKITNSSDKNPFVEIQSELDPIESEPIDLTLLQKEQEEKRNSERINSILERIVTGLESSLLIDKLVIKWLTTSISGCDHAHSHMTSVIRYLAINSFNLVIFKSDDGRNDCIYLFGEQREFAIPYAQLPESIKVFFALFIERSIFFFEKIERVREGICGLFYRRFVYDKQMSTVIHKRAYRKRIMEAFVLHYLYKANLVLYLRSAITTLVSVGVDILIFHVIPVSLPHVAHDRTEIDDYRQIRETMKLYFSLLLHHKILAQKLIHFGRQFEKRKHKTLLLEYRRVEPLLIADKMSKPK